MVGSRNSPQRHVWRARIVLLSADRVGTMAIQRQTGKSKPTIRRWQERFMAAGVDGLLRDATFSRGALYLMLRNRTYRGEIVHNGQSHPGEHPPIIDQLLWELNVRIHSAPAESPRLARFCPPTARSRLFARVCGPGRCSAVSRDGYRAVHGADRREYLCRAKFQYRGVDEAVA